MRQKVQEAVNVTILNNSSVTEVLGDKFVKGIKINSANQEKELAVQGVFVEIGLSA
jgi:thioredoxin reductase